MISSDVSAGTTALASDFNNLRTDAIGTRSLTNRTGGTVAAGDIVVPDTGHDTAFVICGSPTTYGGPILIATESIANLATGLLAVGGYITVNTVGTVTSGHFLKLSSSSPQLVQDAGTDPSIKGIIGVAFTGCTGAGQVTALIYHKPNVTSPTFTDVTVSGNLDLGGTAGYQRISGSDNDVRFRSNNVDQMTLSNGILRPLSDGYVQLGYDDGGSYQARYGSVLSKGLIDLWNKADSAYLGIKLRAGSTAAQYAQVSFVNYNDTSNWTLFKENANAPFLAMYSGRLSASVWYWNDDGTVTSVYGVKSNQLAGRTAGGSINWGLSGVTVNGHSVATGDMVIVTPDSGWRFVFTTDSHLYTNGEIRPAGGVFAGGKLAVQSTTTYGNDLYVAGASGADAVAFVDAVSNNQSAWLTLQGRSSGGTTYTATMQSRADGAFIITPGVGASYHAGQWSPNATRTYDLGASGQFWRDAFIGRTLYLHNGDNSSYEAIDIKPGNSANQNGVIRWRDKDGTSAWAIYKDSGAASSAQLRVYGSNVANDVWIWNSDGSWWSNYGGSFASGKSLRFVHASGDMYIDNPGGIGRSDKTWRTNGDLQMLNGGSYVNVLTAATTAARTWTYPDATGAVTLDTIAKVKASAENVNNSTTLQNDDDFSFSIGANETWIVEITALLSVAASGGSYPGLKFTFTGPSGATMVAQSIVSTATGGSDGSATDTIRAASGTTLGTAVVSMTGGAFTFNTLVWGKFTAVITNGGTAGTVNFQWAQHNAVAVNTTLAAGSVMLAKRVI
jgi:hypothetical protein